ncbi:replication initiation protein [uncultured Fusobacterium sp.]|uniref:replication initiation protein n=1 Tax=uncultured Fusobacterium sp. TaxID=159267 RepID=UPI0025CF0E69|nr:replication initiation protein [uncultured Fusobacterium sp.]
MKKSYFIEFSSPLVKEEKKLIHFLIKREMKLLSLKFLLEELEIPELKNSKLCFIDRFAKKGIYLCSDSEKIYIPIFNSYHLKENCVEFFFNSLFLEYLKNEEKIFQYNLPQILFFKYDFSVKFFYKVIKPNFLNSKIELSLEKFREIIDKDKYKRLYDIKRFLVEPIIEDINISTNFNVSYKIEKENGKYTLVFCLKNIKIDEIKNYVQNFLRLYKCYILNPEKLKFIIFEAIQTHGYNYTKNKLLLTIKNKKKYNLKFDDIFEKFLNNELGEFYIVLKSFECQVKDLDQFRKIIFKELSLLDLSEVITMDYNTSLTKNIFSMKEKEKIEIVSENLKLELIYNSVEKSKITIYLKYTK